MPEVLKGELVKIAVAEAGMANLLPVRRGRLLDNENMPTAFAGFPVGSAIGGALSAIGPEVALGAALVIALVASGLTFAFVPRT